MGHTLKKFSEHSYNMQDSPLLSDCLSLSYIPRGKAFVKVRVPLLCYGRGLAVGWDTEGSEFLSGPHESVICYGIC